MITTIARIIVIAMEHTRRLALKPMIGGEYRRIEIVLSREAEDNEREPVKPITKVVPQGLCRRHYNGCSGIGMCVGQYERWRWHYAPGRRREPSGRWREPAGRRFIGRGVIGR